MIASTRVIQNSRLINILTKLRIIYRCEDCIIQKAAELATLTRMGLIANEGRTPAGQYLQTHQDKLPGQEFSIPITEPDQSAVAWAISKAWAETTPAGYRVLRCVDSIIDELRV